MKVRDSKTGEVIGVVLRVSAAQAAIDAAKAKASRANLCPVGVKALRELVEYNDSVRGNAGKVTREDAAALLRDQFGWVGGARMALDTVCREQLGRVSFSKRGSK